MILTSYLLSIAIPLKIMRITIVILSTVLNNSYNFTKDNLFVNKSASSENLKTDMLNGIFNNNDVDITNRNDHDGSSSAYATCSNRAAGNNDTTTINNDDDTMLFMAKVNFTFMCVLFRNC